MYNTHSTADFEPTFALVAGVFRQAVRDARAGSLEAQEWLQSVAPDFYERLIEGKESMSTKTQAAKTLRAMYRPSALDQIEAQQASRTGEDSRRDLSIIVPKSPAKLAEERRNAEAREAEKARQAQAAANRRTLDVEKKAQEKSAYIHAGGNEKDFERDYWPRRRLELVEAAARATE